jgi:hypothetical protein
MVLSREMNNVIVAVKRHVLPIFVVRRDVLCELVQFVTTRMMNVVIHVN